MTTLRPVAEVPGRLPHAATDESPLRIALVAPPWFTIPPQGYGGTERVVAMLADGLARLGHDVTLFAPGGSSSLATVCETVPEPMFHVIGSGAVDTQNTLMAYRHADRFDVVHDHTVAGLAVAPFLRIPVIHTLHGAILADIRGLYASMPPNVELVAISEAQRRTLPPGVTASLIHNAVDVEGTPWSNEPGEYLLFVGRAAPQKGPLDALRIADRAGFPLRMLLKVNEVPEQEYFETLKPMLRRSGVQVELNTTEAEKRAAYAGALATLFPISWEEPFGLVMIESMAAGTPVIGYRRASVPEVVQDSVTGFVCDDEDSAVEAVGRLGSIDRAACRDRALRCFDVHEALDRHVQLYRSAVSGSLHARPK
jgi:glycosyltransferase involved in cell wall biosynthesis